jgi:hypothetical protein
MRKLPNKLPNRLSNKLSVQFRKTLFEKIRTINFGKTFFKLSFIALILSIFAQMYFTNNLAAKGGELSDLHSRKETLTKELAVLEFEDSQLSALSYIEERAEVLGFVELTGTVMAIRVTPPTSAVALPTN